MSKLVKFGMAPPHVQLVEFQRKAIEVVSKSDVALYDLVYFFNAMSQIDPVPKLSDHIKDRLMTERVETVLLLKLLGYIY
jgi:hypothetical protein